ncbi:LANO_0H23464g1_1 [Lachancea nothofagi CBS 11611]|uniref:LANO_0H23464g1_1 n=1 Tax=Lachancea nothofagi CBS 11611 TaxID=1266666 RepID=A0A1G4KNX0_9SACH|nr:LANO_0H23464g1_1 [Lachancea nothofagi CBS 11611]
MIDTVPLIASLNSENEVHLLVGTHSLNLTVNRARAIVESGAFATIVGPSKSSDVEVLRKRFAGESRVSVLENAFELQHLMTLGRPIVAKIVDRVFVSLAHEQALVMQDIYQQCVKLRIPINTSQRPEFSTFSPISTFTDPAQSGLQIAVTTNGQGCLLANRIKREIVSNLPANISQAVINMGNLRDRIINEDNTSLISGYYLNKDLQDLGYGVDEDNWDSHRLNKLVHEFGMSENEKKLKRSRWLSQIMQYYPLTQLANVSISQLADNYMNSQDKPAENSSMPPGADNSQKELVEQDGTQNSQSKVALASSLGRCRNKENGTISLVGSGPGSVSMLTLGALHEIKTADLILADKLVPETVLALIPKETETFIARKFPGNAERAQQELLEKGLAGLQEGRKVVRLKQGDPYIFGRGGEEFLFFSEHGYVPQVLPGLSSSLTATVVSKIPATQRDVADQVLICTGTGRKGALPQIPEYVVSRTTVFLMALHRSDVLIGALLKQNWDPEVPAAIIERASCPDQRITRTLLKYVPEVVNEIGSRPPGLLVVGRAVGALIDPKLLQFNDNCKYYIEEGLDSSEPQLNLAELLQTCS